MPADGREGGLAAAGKGAAGNVVVGPGFVVLVTTGRTTPAAVVDAADGSGVDGTDATTGLVGGAVGAAVGGAVVGLIPVLAVSCEVGRRVVARLRVVVRLDFAFVVVRFRTTFFAPFFVLAVGFDTLARRAWLLCADATGLSAADASANKHTDTATATGEKKRRMVRRYLSLMRLL